MMNKLQNIYVKGNASQRAGVAFLCALIAFVLAFVIAPSLAWAEPEPGESGSATSRISTAAENVVVVNAPAISSNKDTTKLKATISYDANIVKGQIVRFDYNVTGINPDKDGMIYTLFSFDIQTSTGWTSVLDTSQIKTPTGADTPSYFENPITSAGKYRLRFMVCEYTRNEDGTKKCDDTVQFQAEFTITEQNGLKSVDSVVNEVVAQCEKECPSQYGTSDYAKALWFNDWLVDNVVYDNSLLSSGVEGVFGRGEGTCEAYHSAYVMLLNKVGIQTRRVDSRGDNHVWTGALLDGKWYNVDVTWNDYPDQPSIDIDMKHLYFGLPSEVMKLVHKEWDGYYAISYLSRAPFEADSYEDNYFIRSGAIAKYTKQYVNDVEGSYSVKANLAAGKSDFTLPVVNASWPDSYKGIIYNLVAYQLGQEKWENGAKISASYRGGELVCHATYPVSIEDAKVTDVPTEVTFNGKAYEPKPTVVLEGKLLERNKDYTLSYDNNKNASTASNLAVVTITGIGEYAGTIKETFTIKQLDLSQVGIEKVAYPWPRITYTGSAIEPKPTIRTGDGILDASCIKFVYANNSNVGEATITIKPKDSNCIGSQTSTFEIVCKAITNSSVSVTAPEVIYDGNAKRPVVVKDGSRTLSEGRDYSIAYSNNVSVGTAKATITGINNYSGVRTVEFVIKEKPNTGSSSGSSGSASNSAPSSGATTPPAATSTAGSNSSITPNKPAAVTTQPKPQTQSVSGIWKKSGGKWWFSYDAKTQAAQKKKWPANEWVTIGGKRYHFDSNGYMHANWQKLSSKWYYFGSDGAMKTGWQKVGGKWYYLHTDGIMRTGKINPGDGKTYFLTSSGAMKTGWNKEGAGWYYYAGSGAMAKGWAKVGGKWYYLNPSSGLMQTGFYKVGNSWYYSNGSGAMLTGWQKIGGKYYYFNGSGVMQYNKWVGNYYVGSNGVMATNTWIGKYHVNANGKWDRTK